MSDVRFLPQINTPARTYEGGPMKLPDALHDLSLMWNMAGTLFYSLPKVYLGVTATPQRATELDSARVPQERSL